MTIYLIVALIILIITVIFALQNAVSVTISFLVWEFTGSLSLVLLGTLAVGLLIGWLVLTPSMLKKTFTISSLRKRIEALEKEILDLIQAGDAMKISMAALKNYRETFPDPAAVKRLDLDLDQAVRNLDKTRQEILAARDRMTGIQDRITRCQNQGNELSESKARLEMQLKQVENWLRQYGDWESWEQQIRSKEQDFFSSLSRIRSMESSPEPALWVFRQPDAGSHRFASNPFGSG